jgi:glycogen(starch) synthase
MEDKHDHTILISTDTVGGVWSYTISLVEAMQQYPVKFIIASLGPLPSQDQRQQVEALDNAHMESFDGKLEWMDNPWDDLQEEGEWFKALAATYQPDLVHFNHYAHASIDFNAPKLLVMHSCVRSWWRAVKKQVAPDHWSRYSALVQKAIVASDNIVAPSYAILDAFREEYEGLEKARVIYNGIELSEYEAKAKEPFIFSMGRLWDEAKNIKLLLKAAPFIDFPIYIAGDRDNSNNKNLPDNVHVLGWQDKQQIKDWLSRASLYVLPVKYEPFGLSFLEAAASGCTLVGGKIKTLQEVWNDSAFYCEVNSASELAKLSNIILKDDLLRQEMQRRSRERANLYDEAITAKNYFNLYKTMNSTLSSYEY